MNDSNNDPNCDELEQKAWLVKCELQDLARRRRGCLPEEVIIGAAMRRFPWLRQPRVMRHIHSCADCRASYRLHREVLRGDVRDESDVPRASGWPVLSLPRMAVVLLMLVVVGWAAPRVTESILQMLPQLKSQRQEIARVEQKLSRLREQHDELWRSVDGENLFRVDCAAVVDGSPFAVAVSFSPSVERFALIRRVLVSWGESEGAPYEIVFSRDEQGSRFVATHDYGGAKPGDTFLIRTFIEVADMLAEARELTTRELEKTYRVTIMDDRVTVSEAAPAAIPVHATEAGGLEWVGRYDDPLPWQTVISVRASRDTRRLTLLVRPVSSGTAYVMPGSGALRAGDTRDYSTVLGGGPGVHAGEKMEVLLVEDDHFRPADWSMPFADIPADRVALRIMVGKTGIPVGHQQQPALPALPTGRIVSPADGAVLDTEVAVEAEIDTANLEGRQPCFLIQPHSAPGQYYVQNLPLNMRVEGGKTVFSAMCYLGAAGRDSGYFFDIVLVLAERGRFHAGQSIAPLPSDTPPVGLVTVRKK